MSVYVVDVLHTFPLFTGDSLDGVTLVERGFVPMGNHAIQTSPQRMQQLEADGYIEIISVDGQLNVWPACCACAGTPISSVDDHQG